jgi:hypothetical protein
MREYNITGTYGAIQSSVEAQRLSAFVIEIKGSRPWQQLTGYITAGFSY